MRHVFAGEVIRKNVELPSTKAPFVLLKSEKAFSGPLFLRCVVAFCTMAIAWSGPADANANAVNTAIRQRMLITVNTALVLFIGISFSNSFFIDSLRKPRSKPNGFAFPFFPSPVREVPMSTEPSAASAFPSGCTMPVHKRFKTVSFNNPLLQQNLHGRLVHLLRQTACY